MDNAMKHVVSLAFTAAILGICGAVKGSDVEDCRNAPKHCSRPNPQGLFLHVVVSPTKAMPRTVQPRLHVRQRLARTTGLCGGGQGVP